MYLSKGVRYINWTLTFYLVGMSFVFVSVAKVALIYYTPDMLSQVGPVILRVQVFYGLYNSIMVNSMVL